MLIAGSLAVYVILRAPILHAADIPYEPIARALDTYAQGQYDKALAQLAQLTDFRALRNGFRKEAPKWIAAGSADISNRRRQIVAVVSLEIARLGFIGEKLGPMQFEDAMAVIEAGCTLIRRDAPNAFRHLWLLSSVALIQGAQNIYLASSHEQPFFGVHWRHAQAQFPAEGRFRLAELLTRPEARRMPNRAGTSAFSMTNGSKEQAVTLLGELDPAARVRQAITDYTKLLDYPAIAPEVRLRRGILLFHRSDFAGGLADLQIAITSSSDPYIVYAGHVFKGFALDSLGQPGEAMAAYESALQVIPYARSAALLLAEGLFTTGHQEEAGELLHTTFSAPAPHDPWVELSAGDYRFWASDLQQLREAVRP
jgi:tetratricopeptide (TPR) repeat protein